MRTNKWWQYAVVVLIGAVLSMPATAKDRAPATPEAPQPTVLVIGPSEVDSTTNAGGAATKVGGVVLASGVATNSTVQHSEIWEVVRQFQSKCSAASFVTDPRTPHNLTIRVDYQKYSNGLFGTVDLYQLVLLDHTNNPVFITKKKWLRREIKPVCKAIRAQK